MKFCFSNDVPNFLSYLLLSPNRSISCMSPTNSIVSGVPLYLNYCPIDLEICPTFKKVLVCNGSKGFTENPQELQQVAQLM